MKINFHIIDIIYYFFLYLNGETIRFSIEFNFYITIIIKMNITGAKEAEYTMRDDGSDNYIFVYCNKIDGEFTKWFSHKGTFNLCQNVYTAVLAQADIHQCEIYYVFYKLDEESQPCYFTEITLYRNNMTMTQRDLSYIDDPNIPPVKIEEIIEEFDDE
jgi:hypothetical protein